MGKRWTMRGTKNERPKRRCQWLVIDVSWAIGMFFYLYHIFFSFTYIFFFHFNDDSWPLFIITEFTEAELISPQNDARCATILALPPQIEADILPADVADTIRSLWLDAYNGKPPLEFFFSLKCLFTRFDETTTSNHNHNHRRQWQPSLALAVSCTP